MKLETTDYTDLCRGESETMHVHNLGDASLSHQHYPTRDYVYGAVHLTDCLHYFDARVVPVGPRGTVSVKVEGSTGDGDGRVRYENVSYLTREQARALRDALNAADLSDPVPVESLAPDMACAGSDR